jgi:hypothetical protein
MNMSFTEVLGIAACGFFTCKIPSYLTGDISGLPFIVNLLRSSFVWAIQFPYADSAYFLHKALTHKIVTTHNQRLALCVMRSAFLRNNGFRELR